MSGKATAMRFTEFGTYLPANAPDVDVNIHDAASKVCPFSPLALNEDVLGDKLYGHLPHRDPKLGYYLEVKVGAAREGGFREAGSSGGLTNWILTRLLESGKVDAVVGVGSNETSGSQDPMFSYRVARTTEQVKLFAKSKYYPVELSRVIDEIRTTPGRYAIVGVPCFVKTIRNLCEQDEVLRDRIKYVLALVCGHIKSAAFAQNLAWQGGMKPEVLRQFDFRVKVPNEPANRYAVTAKGEQGGAPVTVTKQVFDLQGTDWGLGYFKLKACDYCDDIGGETADATLGDAWLPAEVKDWRGTNILIIRNREIGELLADAARSEQIDLRSATPADFISSQAANYRHRHDGLGVRLEMADKAGEWRPVKRIPAGSAGVSTSRKEMYVLRALIAHRSHLAHRAAVDSGKLGPFHRQMRMPVWRYYRASGMLTKFLAKTLLIKMRAARNYFKSKPVG